MREWNRNFIFVFMLRLVTHIERLLWVHDCVIVPNLGGFVLQSIPAIYLQEEHVFRPMHKEILFNSTLTHQDGLLSESYMRTYGLDFRKANEMVGQDVDVLRHRLYENNRLDLGTIGTLSVGEEGQLIFSAIENHSLSVDAYGLPSFYFKPLTLLKQERQILFIPDHTLKKEKKDAIYIRINWGGVRVGATAAVVAAFVFLVSTPVKNVNPLMYTASFVPVELSVSKSENEVSAGVTDEKIIRFSGETVDTLSDVLEQEVRTVVPKTGKTYYIVIGSFPNETLSEKFMNQIDRGLSPNAGYVRKGDKVRVYSDKFDNREDAEAYLSQLRQTGKHSDAWLFISR